MIKITKAGWIYIIITILLGIASANTGNNLVYLIDASMLAFMGISGIFGKLNISKLDVEISFPMEVFAKEKFPMTISIENKKNFLPSFLIKLQINGKYVIFPYIDNKDKEIVVIQHIFNKRGIQKIENIHICSVFPFNFFVRCKKINKTFETVVFPKPEKCDLYLQNKNNQKKQLKEGKIKSFEGEISGITDYKEGYPLKFISWKHSAKTQKLKVKELFLDSNIPVVIDLNEIQAENIEQRLSCATYMIIKHYKQKIPVGLKIKNKTLKPSLSLSSKLKMLKELALYD